MSLQLFELANTNGDKSYLAQFSADKVWNDINDYEAILIIDGSGSMYNYTSLYTNYIPRLSKHLGYNQDKKFHIIIFESEIHYTYDSLDTIRHFKPRGGTAAELPAFCLINNSSANGCNSNRIFIPGGKYKMYFFTDGGFNDQQCALMAWNQLKENMFNNCINCDTYAFRIGNTAEAIGLIPFLQINKAQDESLQLYDVSGSDLKGNSFPKLTNKASYNLAFEQACVSYFPFEKLASNITIRDGDFLFLNNVDLKIFSPPVPLFKSTLTLDVLTQYITNWIRKLSLDKIINPNFNTADIIGWIKNEVNTIESKMEGNSTYTNYKFLRELRDRHNHIGQIYEKLRNLNTLTKLNSMNSQQQATYLREISNSTLGRSMAKRTAKYDINKDTALTIKNEFKSLRHVIHELDEVDDSNHQSSMISLETTLGALREIARNLTDEEIDTFDVEQLIGLLHIVGIGVNAPIGEYPDPMVYHIDKVTFLFVSLADVLNAELNGKSLKPPGSNVEINNVIPIFEDMRIFRFCYKYLRNSIELLSGVGMRRILAFIPQTSKYTALVGLWAIVSEEPQQWTYSLIHILLPQVKELFSGWFDYVVNDMIEPEPFDNTAPRQLYIGNNGITNMILPIYEICTNFQDKKHFLPAIYRALYSFELASVARKLNRYEIQINEKFDFFKHCLVTDLEISNQWLFNTKYLESLLKKRWFMRNLFLIEYALTKSYEEFRDFKLTDEYITGRLGIDYSFREFQYATLIQAFLHKNKSERCEEYNPCINLEKKERSKVVDLKTRSVMLQYIQSIVDKKYEVVQHKLRLKKFEKELAAAHRRYGETLASLPYFEFLTAYRNGFKVGDEILNIHTNEDNFRYVFRYMKTYPGVDMNKKCLFFILGKDLETGSIFNSGNMNLSLIRGSKKYLSDEDINTLQGYIGSRVHTYREKPNQHGHSNEKPSFFAFGFESFELFKNTVSPKELSEYLEIHTDCCVPFAKMKRKLK